MKQKKPQQLALCASDYQMGLMEALYSKDPLRLRAHILRWRDFMEPDTVIRYETSDSKTLEKDMYGMIASDARMPYEMRVEAREWLSQNEGEGK